MGGQERRTEAAGKARRDDPKLLAQSAELLGKLGSGVGLGHSIGEIVIKNGQVTREGKAMGGGIEKALEKTDLVGFSPDPVELERGRFGVEIESG